MQGKAWSEILILPFTSPITENYSHRHGAVIVSQELSKFRLILFSSPPQGLPSSVDVPSVTMSRCHADVTWIPRDILGTAGQVRFSQGGD